MALVYIDGNDPWLMEYEACDNLFREIMEQMTLRDREPRTSQAFASLSANIRMRLKQYSGQVRELKLKVDEACRQRIITKEEAERRTRQVEQLQSRDIQLQRMYESKTNELALSRAKLLGPSTSAFADGGTTSWGLDDEDDDYGNDTRRLVDVHVSVEDLKTQKRQLLEQQEEGLEELSKIISRQKQIAQTIHSEVDTHNEIIDDLANHIDRTDDRLIDGTQNIRTITRKDRVCGYWVVIVILFIAIITCALV